MALGIVLGCKWNCHQIFWSACFASASYPPWMQGIQRLGRHQFMFAGRLVMAARDRKLSPPLRINQRFISFFSLSLSLFFPPLSLSLFLLSFFFVALLLSVSVSSYPIFSLHFKSGTKGRRRRSRGAIRIFTPSIHHPGDIWKP